MLSDDDRRYILEQILEHLNAHCLAEVEGRGGGWLGFFLRDHIEEALQAINEGERE